MNSLKDLYLVNIGDNIAVKDKTLFIDDEYFPIEQLKSISLYANYKITSALISMCNKHDILIHHFNWYGTKIGTFYPDNHKYMNKYILKQYEISQSKIMSSKLRNQMVYEYAKQQNAMISYYRRRGYHEFIPAEIIKNDNIGIMEAINKQNYYKIWHELCSYYGFDFEYRSYKPPHNQLNSLMSFMYGLLYKDIIQSIYKQGLDPRLSFNHAINDRRNSALEYDISDYIKPILMDRLIFRLIRTRKIIVEDFDSDTKYLTIDSMKKVISEYQKFMCKQYSYNDGKFNGYQLIDQHIYKLKEYLINGTKIIGSKPK